MSKALINSDMSHDKFNVEINEKQNCFKLKESTRAKDNQLSYVIRDRLIDYLSINIIDY